MNCLHSCFKNLVFRGRQLVGATPAEDDRMERDWGMEPCWFLGLCSGIDIHAWREHG